MNVLELIHKRGACRTADKEIFFPPYDSPSANAKAKEICDRCPVKAECLDWALDHEEEGVWGGTGESERNALVRKRERVHCIICQSENILEVDNFEVCAECGTSWPV